jgi:hypothetical protein
LDLSLFYLPYIFYPLPFDPCHNWLSDLGDPLKNPIGRYFYNAGCLIISVLSIAFYAGMYQWHTKSRNMKTKILIMQGSGIFSSLALLITALFPLGVHTVIHSFWSFLLYIGLGVNELFLAGITFSVPRAKKWTAYYGIAAMGINYITLGWTFAKFYIGEWITVALFYLYIIIITCQYDGYIYNDKLRRITLLTI